jgi:hypothetical protein
VRREVVRSNARILAKTIERASKSPVAAAKQVLDCARQLKRKEGSERSEAVAEATTQKATAEIVSEIPQLKLADTLKIAAGEQHAARRDFMTCGICNCRFSSADHPHRVPLSGDDEEVQDSFGRCHFRRR